MLKLKSHFQSNPWCQWHAINSKKLDFTEIIQIQQFCCVNYIKTKTLLIYLPPVLVVSVPLVEQLCGFFVSGDSGLPQLVHAPVLGRQLEVFSVLIHPLTSGTTKKEKVLFWFLFKLAFHLFVTATNNYTAQVWTANWLESRSCV